MKNRIHLNLIFAIITIALAPTVRAEETSSASFDPNAWKAGFYARYRYEDQSQFDLVNTKEFSSFRLRPNVTFTGMKNVKIYIEPQYNKIAGNQVFEPSSATGNTATETSANKSYDGANDAFNLRSGYLDITLTENFNLVVGRQALAYGDENILGVSDWGVYGRTFDAALLRITAPKTSIDIFQSKIVDTVNTGANLGDDKTLYGIHATFTPVEQIKAWDVYGFYLDDEQNQKANTTDPTRPWHFGVYGSRLVTQFDRLSWKAEYAKDYGSENTPVLDADSSDDMIDTTVGYQIDEAKKHTLALEYFRGGQNWRDLYPTPFTALGRTDVLGRRNLTGGALKWNAKWADRWVTDVETYYFTRTSTDATAYQVDSKSTLGNLTSDSSEVGMEFDLAGKFLMSKNVTFTLGANFFRAGQYLADSLGGRKPEPYYGYFSIETKF